MTKWAERTELLLGKEKLAKFADSHVLVIGLGGVGACAAELLCRAGIGHLTIIDGDTVDETDPTEIRIADIEESYSCKLAKIVRKRLHRRGICGGFQVVFSPEKVQGEIIRPEEAATSADQIEPDNFTKAGSTVGTISYMPAIFGCYCASVVLRNL